MTQVFGHGFHLDGRAIMLWAFPGQRGKPHPVVTMAANLLKARETPCILHWYNHLAIVFVPSIGLEDVTAHVEAFTKFTLQALNDSR